MTIPTNTQEPFTYVDFSSSQATTGPALKSYKALLIGQRTNGSVAADEVTRVRSAIEAGEFFGSGSMLHRMAISWFANNTATELWAVAQDDAGSAVAATKTITISGTATASGTLYIYVGGQRVTVAVSDGDTAATVAAALEAALDAETDLPVTAGVAAAVVTLTARNAGASGQDLDVRANFQADEFYPAGISAAFANGTTGATNPDVTEAFDALGEEQYDVIVVGYDDATTLDEIETEMADRWGPTKAIEGVVFVGTKGTLSTLTTKADAENSRFLALVGADEAPSPPIEWAAAMGAVAAFYLAEDPAAPLKTLPLKGVKPPVADKRFNLTERESMIDAGLMTWIVTAGEVIVSRVVSTYKTNSQGTPDKSFQDLSTVLHLGYLRYDYRVQISNRFPRHKLADDGTSFGVGQKVVTPSILQGESVAIARGWADLGLIERIDEFVDEITVERDSQNVNRINVNMAPNLTNKYLVTAADVAFKS